MLWGDSWKQSESRWGTDRERNEKGMKAEEDLSWSPPRPINSHLLRLQNMWPQLDSQATSAHHKSRNHIFTTEDFHVNIFLWEPSASWRPLSHRSPRLSQTECFYPETFQTRSTPGAGTGLWIKNSRSKNFVSIETVWVHYGKCFLLLPRRQSSNVKWMWHTAEWCGRLAISQ